VHYATSQVQNCAFILLELEQRQIRLYGEPRVSCLVSGATYISASKIQCTRQKGLARAPVEEVASYGSSIGKPSLPFENEHEKEPFGIPGPSYMI
jgi:hypothetical protein